MRHLVLPLLLASALFAAPLQAQPDSVNPAGSARTLRPDKPRRSPMGALLRSVAVPGWGQYYNHKYIKSAVVFGAESFFIMKSVQWWNKAEDQYKLAQQSKSGRDFTTYLNYRDRRNDYLWLTGLAVFLSMFDAYVDAHLSGFDVDLTPDFADDAGGARLKVTYTF